MRYSIMLLVAGFVTGSATTARSAESNSTPANQEPASQEPTAKGAEARTWAEIVIKGDYAEGASMPGLFGAVSESLDDGLGRLDRAAGDSRIAGVVLKLRGPSLGWAKLHEFRQAIARVRKQGKPVVAWMPNGSSRGYLLASACDEIVMPESGALMLLGLRTEVTFYKNLFDRLSIQPEMLRVGEFKSAAEPYTRTSMSEPFRKEMEALLDDYYEQIVQMVRQGRELEKEKVIAAIDSGPHMAPQALKLGMINRLAYEDELPVLLAERHPGAKVTIIKSYGKKKIDTDFSGLTGMIKMMNMMMGIEPNRAIGSNSRIAVVHANGVIMSGTSQADLFGGKTLGARTLIRAVEAAEKDPSVKAIVLRINSPGGSALASDLMWRALEKVEKPFVVSMGDVAASGGYYIAMGADRIFAEPGTLTGSIGVVGGKLALGGLLEKVGVTTSVISRGGNSGVLSPLSGFSEGERAAMVRMLQTVYEQFTRKAAAGRKMPYEKLEALARGRVYTGNMALDNGLIDEIGTLDDAVAHAQKLAGLKPNQKMQRLILPRPVSPFEQLFGPLAASGSPTNGGFASQRALGHVLPEALVEQFGALRMINLLAREHRLTLMPFRIVVK